MAVTFMLGRARQEESSQTVPTQLAKLQPWNKEKVIERALEQTLFMVIKFEGGTVHDKL